MRDRGKAGFRRAVTLIEAVLFISIALGLIVGGLVFYNQASKSQMAGETARLFTAVVSEAQALRKEIDSFLGTALGAVLVARESIPSSYLMEGIDPSVLLECKIRAPWGGCVIPRADVSGGVTFVSIVAYGMPPEICARLMQSDSAGNSPLGSGFAYAEISWDPDGDYFVLGSIENTVRHVIEQDGALTPSSPGQCLGGRCVAPAPFCSTLTGNRNELISFGFRL